MSGSLDHSPADVLRHLLINLSLGTLPTDEGAWPVYATQEPDSPDNCITCIDTAGVQDGRTMTDGMMHEHYGIQVRMRATTHAVGHAKASAIAVALDQDVAMDSVVIGSDVYNVHAVSRRSGPFSIGEESPTSKRRVFTLNVIAAITQLS